MMRNKKWLPVLLLVVMAIATISINKCNDRKVNKSSSASTKTRPSFSVGTARDNTKFDRNTTTYFFTKHARCRMACRKITQREVKDIVARGNINYAKSNLNDARGATYALEGITDDGQRVRIIVSPKQRHLSVITVIDLENDYECDCK